MLKNFNRPGTRIYLLATVVLILGFVPGCSSVPRYSSVPSKIAAPVPLANTTGHSSLEAGRKIYVSWLKCAMCHRPKPVSDYSAETWAEDILPRMSKKAKLSPQQYADVLAYVTSTTTQQ